jgi:hypothetical protein
MCTPPITISFGDGETFPLSTYGAQRADHDALSSLTRTQSGGLTLTTAHSAFVVDIPHSTMRRALACAADIASVAGNQQGCACVSHDTHPPDFIHIEPLRLHTPNREKTSLPRAL